MGKITTPDIIQFSEAQTQVVLENLESTQALLEQAKALEEAGLDMTDVIKAAELAITQGEILKKTFIDKV